MLYRSVVSVSTIVYACLFVLDESSAFQTVSAIESFAFRAKRGDSDPEVDPVTKASWYAVEMFGKVFGRNGPSTDPVSLAAFDLSQPPRSRQETLARLQDDNEREYFLSGKVDAQIYSPDCLFADPFVSFQGRDRFIENLANLGSFITKYSAKPLQYDEIDESSVETKFMVKLELNLPWKPVLAWPWGVRCELDPITNLIVVHEERWDIEPLEVRFNHIFRMNCLQPSTLILHGRA